MTGLSVAQVAARDQAQALVRDLSAGGTTVIFADYPAGQTCCWCNCPATAPDTDPCGGCTAPAEAVLRVYSQPEDSGAWPVCGAHYDDCMHALQLLLAVHITALSG